MDKITSDDTGVFFITTKNGSYYTLTREENGRTTLSGTNNALPHIETVNVLTCEINKPGKFGLFPNPTKPEWYYLYQTSPIVSIRAAEN